MTVVRELVARLGFKVDQSGFKAAEKSLENVRKAIRRTDDSLGRSRSSAARSRMRDASGRFVGAAAAAAGGGGGSYRDSRSGGARGGAAGTPGGKGGDGNVMATLGKLAATAGLTHMLQGMVELASAAEETKNVLSAVFGAEGQADVSQWAERMSVQLGRSKYDLQKFVGELGAVATPMLQNKDKAREMSESLAALAVDMASFYNSSDADALAALRSALTGEVESIKRYGVVMNEATMQEYAHTKGINKKISAMTIAEKTELRYGFIMKTTAAAQGDAARTSEGFANSIKRVKALLTDFGTDMGSSVLPKIEKLLVMVRHGVDDFREMTKGTIVLEAAMWTLSGVAGALALSLIAPFILPAVAIAGLILLIDELHGLFTGSDSVIGGWIDSMLGMGAAEEIVLSIRDAMNELNETALPDAIGAFDILSGAIDDVGFAVQRLIDKFVELMTLPSRAAGAINEGFVGLLKKIPGYKESSYQPPGGTKNNFDYEYKRAKGQGTDAGAYESVRDEVTAKRTDRERTVMAQVAERRAKSVEARRQREIDAKLDQEESLMSVNDPSIEANTLRFGRVRRGRLAEREARAKQMATPAVAAAREDWTGGMSLDPSIFPQQSVSAPAGASAPANASMAPVVHQTNTNTIHINGGNPNELRKVAQQVFDANNRKAAAAISRPAGG